MKGIYYNIVTLLRLIKKEIDKKHIMSHWTKTFKCLIMQHEWVRLYFERWRYSKEEWTGIISDWRHPALYSSECSQSEMSYRSSQKTPEPDWNILFWDILIRPAVLCAARCLRPRWMKRWNSECVCGPRKRINQVKKNSIWYERISFDLFWA